MAVMDEFREERAAIRHGTPKQKFLYFCTYYGWATIAVILITAFIGYLTFIIVSKKDQVFFAAVLNSTAMESADDYSRSFLEYTGYDPKKYAAEFDNTMYMSFSSYDETSSTSSDKLTVYMAARQLDVIIAGDELYEHYANAGTFCDLTDILSEEQIEKYKPYFYYVDVPLVAQIYQAEINMDNTFKPELPDPTKPELMEDPVPVGIYVESSEKLTDSFYIREGDRVVLGVVSNTNRPDMAVKYIDFVFQD